MHVPGCTGKIGYGHQETAEKACEAMLKKHGESLEAYECDNCGGWHIGHPVGGGGTWIVIELATHEASE